MDQLKKKSTDFFWKTNKPGCKTNDHRCKTNSHSLNEPQIACKEVPGEIVHWRIPLPNFFSKHVKTDSEYDEINSEI